MKDLPHVFKGDVRETKNSNMAYAKAEDEIKEEKTIYEKTINQKINEIFSSNTYVYKKEVIIKTNEGTQTKQIVGRNKEYLMTLENELIPLKDIIDIYPK